MFTFWGMYSFVFIIIILSCSPHNKEIYDIVEEWEGKEIIFPEGLTYSIKGERLMFANPSTDFTVVTYIDSSGCTPCRMRLREWDEVINNLNSLTDYDVGFVMFLNGSLAEDLRFGVETRNFLHPIAEDPGGAFDKTNGLPSKEAYHTFLLNSDNEVVVLGNPVTNPKVREIYIKAIAESSERKISEFSKVESRLCAYPVKPLGVISKGETVNTKFRIFDRDSVSYSIQEIISSCDCTSAVASTPSMMPGEGIDIDVTFTADSIPGEFHRYIDVFFNEKKNPVRLKIHGFIK